jgi:hypothetical protein
MWRKAELMVMVSMLLLLEADSKAMMSATTLSLATTSIAGTASV